MDIPFGLTDAFAQDTQKITQWKAFLNKNKLEGGEQEEVVLLLYTFLMPAVTSTSIDNNWQAGVAWVSKNI